MQAQGLNIVLNEQFVEESEGHRIMNDLSELPFYTPSFRICGRNYRPHRKIIGFGEPNLEYKFSGHTVYARAWTPALLKVKELVEKECGCAFNFALLNFYPDGNSRLGHHKDNETSLDSDAPIATLSLGATRTMEFRSPDEQNPIRISLPHGSLFIMKPPTNSLFTHAILGDPDLQECRISITFRKMLMSEPSRKRPRMEGIPSGDWMEKLMQGEDSMPPAMFEMTPSLLVTAKQSFKNFYVDIRHHIPHKHLKAPTKEGIMLSGKQWYYFANNLHEYNSLYDDSPTIMGSDLIAMAVNDYCHLQQLSVCDDQKVFLKPNFIRLNAYEVSALKENMQNMHESIVNVLWSKFIPMQFARRNNEDVSMMFSDVAMREAFIIILENSLNPVIKKNFRCNGCLVDSMSQLNHDCMLFTQRQKLDNSFKLDITLLIDIEKLLSDMTQRSIFSNEFLYNIDIKEFFGLLYRREED